MRRSNNRSLKLSRLGTFRCCKTTNDCCIQNYRLWVRIIQSSCWWRSKIAVSLHAFRIRDRPCSYNTRIGSEKWETALSSQAAGNRSQCRHPTIPSTLTWAPRCAVVSWICWLILAPVISKHLRGRESTPAACHHFWVESRWPHHWFLEPLPRISWATILEKSFDYLESLPSKLISSHLRARIPGNG